jgi:hypothetical protein
MKKIILILVLALFFSCSDDENNTPEPEPQLNFSEKLVNGSPYVFASTEIISVINNSGGYSNSELIDFALTYDKPEFAFSTGGNAVITYENNVINATYNIINGNMVMTASDNSTLELTGFQFNENDTEVTSFSFVQEYEWFDFDTEQGAFWEARDTYQ